MKKNKIISIISVLLSIVTIGAIAKVGNEFSKNASEREMKLAIKEKILKLDIKFFYENFEPEVDEKGLQYWCGDIYFQVNNFYTNFKYEDIESTTLYYSNNPDENTFKKHDIRTITQYELGDYFNAYFGSHLYYAGEHYFKISLKIKNYDTPLTCKGMIEIV